MEIYATWRFDGDGRKNLVAALGELGFRKRVLRHSLVLDGVEVCFRSRAGYALPFFALSRQATVTEVSLSAKNIESARTFYADINRVILENSGRIYCNARPELR